MNDLIKTEDCNEYVQENITFDELYEWFLLEFEKKSLAEKVKIIQDLGDLK